ncbi:MAG: YCF48-related protein [Planctomycetota bacterium]
MKRLLIALLISSSATLLAQTPSVNRVSPSGGSRWTKQAPIPTSFSVKSMVALSETELWGAASPFFGAGGELVHSTDGGATWEPVIELGHINAVYFVDAQHGWVAGNGLWHTTDGGETWIQDNNWGTMQDIHFVDTLHGWCSGNGGIAYYTTNGGLSWTGVSTGGGSTMSSIFFLDQSEGWTVSISGRIMHTTDGGSSWSLSHDVGDPVANLQTVQFLDSQNGWVVGGDTFLKTTDGGQTWSQTPVPAGTWAFGARFRDRNNGIAVGEYGNILRTTNGQTWQTERPVGSGMRYWEAEFVSETVAYVGGDNGAIAKSVDGGSSWNMISSGATWTTRAIDWLDGDTAWLAAQGGEIAKTTNGGKLWERVSVTGFDIYGNLHGVDFADEQFGWAVGDNEVFGFVYPDGRISRSTDGGETWTPQFSQNGIEFFGVTALDAQTALAYGRGTFASSACIRTTNGGQTWHGVTGLNVTNGFRDAFFLPGSQTGWIVGNDIFKSTDGGASWSYQASGNGAQLAGVSFCDAQNGWVVGFANQILHTTDGGQIWAPQTFDAPPLTAFMGVTAVSPQVAWLSGWYGTVAKTTDGGQTWVAVPIEGTDGAYFELAEFMDAENGWIGGDQGVWKRTGIQKR